MDPWTPRCIEIRGRAELHHDGGQERFGGGGWDDLKLQLQEGHGAVRCRPADASLAARPVRQPAAAD